MRPSVQEYAPAKLNLALSVGPRDDTGRHPICSWMVTVNLVDELHITRLEDDRLSRYAVLWHADARRRTEIDWSVTRDLAVRAHLKLEEKIGRAMPVQMKLEKRIPVGGGLGGGSSDAAAMLRAVNQLFDLGLTSTELTAIGAELGSDVPFFVQGGSAIVRGSGETIEPHAQTPDLHAVVVMPETPCDTASVYQQFDALAAEHMTSPALRETNVKQLAEQSGVTPNPEALFNDLADPAMRLANELIELRKQLSELADRPAQLTGSGSSLFVLCDDALHAEALAQAVEQKLNIPAVQVGTQPAVSAHVHERTEVQ